MAVAEQNVLTVIIGENGMKYKVINVRNRIVIQRTAHSEQ